LKNRFNLGLDYLRTLQALRDYGTLLDAAAARHISGPAAAAQLATLSKWVGSPLVYRRGRGVHLTQQALILLEHGDLILAELERAQADFAKLRAGESGSVSIGSFALGLRRIVVPCISIMRSDRPDMVIAAHEMGTPECLKALDKGDLDVAIAFDYPSFAEFDDARYRRIDLLQSELFVVLPRKHPLAKRKTVNVQNLSKESWIIGTPSNGFTSIALMVLSSSSVSPKIVHRCDDWDTVLSLVSLGEGVSVAPELALREAGEHIAMVPIEVPKYELRVYAAVRNGAEEEPHIASVLTALREAAQN
jgi:DNA-binding transcriptional LysR family regulator